MRLPFSIFKHLAPVFIAATIAASPWWNSDFTKRIPIVLAETNGYYRTNSYILIDFSSLPTDMGLVDTSGADIRIVNSNDTELLPSRIIHRVGGTAAAVVYLNTLPSNVTSITNFLYYNYSPAAGELIPTVPLSSKMKIRRGYERYYTPNLEPALYFLRVGIVGNYVDASYLGSALNLSYNYIFTVPFDTADYDVLLQNKGDTFMRTNIYNYQYFIQKGGGFLDTDMAGRTGDSWDRWLACTLPFFDFYQINYLPYVANADIMDDGVRTAASYVTNTNHFVSMDITNVTTAKIIEVLNAYPYIFRTWAERHLNNTPIDKDLGNSGQNGIYVRDYRSLPYNSNNTIINNGRYGMCSYLSFLTGTNFTDLGRRLVTRQFIWLAGYEDLGVGYPPPRTVGAPQVYTFVKSILLAAESPSFLSGTSIAGKILYYSNMNTANTPIMKFSNMNTAVTYSISMGSGSVWADSSTYSFTGTYSSTPVPGKYAIIVSSNFMLASSGAGASNDYILKNVFYDTAAKWNDYRCIPQVISRAGMGNLGSTYVLVSAPSATTITAVVYNKKGIPVRTLVRDGALDLSRNIIWDGKSDNNLPVIAGIYVIKMDIKNRGTYYARVRVID